MFWLSLYSRMLYSVFWSQTEYKIVLFYLNESDNVDVNCFLHSD